MAKGCYPVYPVHKILPYGETSKNINGVIAKLGELFPYFVLEESHRK